MISERWIRKTIYILMVCRSIRSVPIDMSYDVMKQNDATLSGYKSLSAPKWPYTTPMKPTLPYTFEKTHNMQKFRHKTNMNSTLSDISSSFRGINHSTISENEINFVQKKDNNQISIPLQIHNAEKKDKEEFIYFLRSLLWDAEVESTQNDQIQGRQLNLNYSPIGGGYYGNQLGMTQQQQAILRWHGVLGRPMPQILKKQGLASQAYRGFENTCYKLACTLGINKLISQIGRMLG